MEKKNFSLLEEIIKKNIDETIQNKNLNLMKFFQEMEQGFKDLGFRDVNNLGGA